MIRLTENLMSLIITDWLNQEVNKDDARGAGKQETDGGVQRTDRSYAITRTHTCKTRFLPPEKADSPDGNKKHSVSSCILARLGSEPGDGGALYLRGQQWRPLSHSHTPLLSFSHVEATQLPRRSSQPEPTCCSFFIAFYFFSFPFVVDSLKHSSARVCVCVFLPGPPSDFGPLIPPPSYRQHP